MADHKRVLLDYIHNMFSGSLDDLITDLTQLKEKYSHSKYHGLEIEEVDGHNNMILGLYGIRSLTEKEIAIKKRKEAREKERKRKKREKEKSKKEEKERKQYEKLKAKFEGR